MVRYINYYINCPRCFVSTFHYLFHGITIRFEIGNQTDILQLHHWNNNNNRALLLPKIWNYIKKYTRIYRIESVRWRLNDRTRIRIFEPTRRWRLSTVIVVAAAAAARVAAYPDRERYFISRLSIPQNRAQPNIHGSSSINPPPLPNPLSSPILRLPRTNASPTSQRRNPSPSKNTRIEQKFTNTIVINIFTILRTFISQDISMDRPSRCYIYIYMIYISGILLFSSPRWLKHHRSFARSFVRSFGLVGGKIGRR